jgi:hypothetical protein
MCHFQQYFTCIMAVKLFLFVEKTRVPIPLAGVQLISLVAIGADSCSVYINIYYKNNIILLEFFL